MKNEGLFIDHNKETQKIELFATECHEEQENVGHGIDGCDVREALRDMRRK